MTTNYNTVINNEGPGGQFVIGAQGQVRQAAGHALSSAEALALVQHMWDALEDLRLDQVDQADYVSAVSHIEEEVARPQPKRGRLRRGLETVTEFLRGHPIESAQLALSAAATLGRFYGVIVTA
ncbi:hypothetical protein ACQEU5_17740 [Marinactinospora thermotolerans]|nr:hypothetical protein [Marinactinospora thermotolerans]